MRGIVRQAKQVTATARSLANLILELAQLEAKRNAAAFGKAAGLASPPASLSSTRSDSCSRRRPQG